MNSEYRTEVISANTEEALNARISEWKKKNPYEVTGIFIKSVSELNRYILEGTIEFKFKSEDVQAYDDDLLDIINLEPSTAEYHLKFSDNEIQQLLAEENFEDYIEQLRNQNNINIPMDYELTSILTIENPKIKDNLINQEFRISNINN